MPNEKTKHRTKAAASQLETIAEALTGGDDSDSGSTISENVSTLTRIADENITRIIDVLSSIKQEDYDSSSERYKARRSHIIGVATLVQAIIVARLEGLSEEPFERHEIDGFVKQYADHLKSLHAASIRTEFERKRRAA